MLLRLLWAFCVALLLPAVAGAAISVDRTRLIVTAQEREASVQVLNEGTRPVLIQAWVDTGDEQMAVERIHAPFIVDLPVFRLEPGRSRRLRVLMTQSPAGLPADQESVYWFNVMEIPPKPSAAADRNYLQVSFRTRIKLFFRPDAIARYVQPEQNQMRFSMSRDALGKPVLRIENPTPLHQSMTALTVQSAGGEQIRLEPDMIAPFQHAEFPLTGAVAWANHPGLRVRFATVNDYGIAREDEQPVSPFRVDKNP